jgi:N-methylhydantoinase A
VLSELSEDAAEALDAENVPRNDQSMQYEVDVRYHGQGLSLPIEVDLAMFSSGGLESVRASFDAAHTQLFTFSLDVEQEVVNLRAVAQGKATSLTAQAVEEGGEDPSPAAVDTTTIFVDNSDQDATVYDRSKLLAGNRIAGPAIVTEMDSTTLILPGHVGEVDTSGNILINPLAN